MKMSETVTSQDLPEMSRALEMGKLRKINTLEDISLAEPEDNFQRSSAESERKLKTNSLKRLFRLSSKKKLDNGPLEAEQSEFELEIDEAARRTNLTGTFSKASLKSSFSSYWSSVFKTKKSGKSPIENSQEMDCNLQQAACSTNTDNCLAKATVQDLQHNVCAPKDTSVLEELQSLNISQECPQK